MNFQNILLLLAMQKMMQKPPVTAIEQQAKKEEYNNMAISHRAAGGRESDLNPMLQYFVQNPTGSDTGAHQERQEIAQQAISADPLLSVFQQALIQS